MIKYTVYLHNLHSSCMVLQLASGQVTWRKQESVYLCRLKFSYRQSHCLSICIIHDQFALLLQQQSLFSQLQCMSAWCVTTFAESGLRHAFSFSTVMISYATQLVFDLWALALTFGSMTFPMHHCSYFTGYVNNVQLYITSESFSLKLSL